ncbi:hypothetical protein D7322_23555 [Sphingobacterium puteale]|uniref:Uncharacterized protein n=2 Tax=Sphingobacterium puteale TaxID=2420510 RepID=A0A420VSA0_9SPHI|nr:hypothetical protein D7322_23555 [Sphingobacterium puteale]
MGQSDQSETIKRSTMNLFKYLIISFLFTLSSCSTYYINFPDRTTFEETILDTLNFKNFSCYSREEFYTYPEQDTATKIGIHYLFIEKTSDTLKRVLNLVPIKPYRQRLGAPQYASNYTNQPDSIVNLSNYIIYQMGYLHRDKIIFTNQRKKRNIVPTLYIKQSDNRLEIDKVYYPNKDTYKISEFIKEGIIYHKINPTIKVRLNPDNNCGIMDWGVADMFYITKEGIIFKFQQEICDKKHYFSFKKYQD